MKAHPAAGDLYRQEFLLGVAEDVGEVLSLSESVTAGGHTYTEALKTKDTTPLAPDDVENKFYARGVGEVLTVDVSTGQRSELIEVRTGP